MADVISEGMAAFPEVQISGSEPVGRLRGRITADTAGAALIVLGVDRRRLRRVRMGAVLRAVLRSAIGPVTVVGYSRDADSEITLPETAEIQKHKKRTRRDGG